MCNIFIFDAFRLPETGVSLRKEQKHIVVLSQLPLLFRFYHAVKLTTLQRLEQRQFMRTRSDPSAENKLTLAML